MPETHPITRVSGKDRDRLLSAAKSVAEQSYSPYSGFRVGAALLLVSGDLVTGCNVENGSYRLTCCAEQSAVANLNGAASMPCGACRQTLAEFAEDDIPVFFPGEGGEACEMTLSALLPHAFRLRF